MRLRQFIFSTAAFSAYAASASAVVRFEVTDMGVPMNGSVVMTGYRGFVVRAISDPSDGRIARINTGYQGGTAGAIVGGLAQRWEAPATPGNYTARSPGPIAANNTFDSDFNFDSHFTFDPSSVTLEPLSVGPYESMPTATTYEDAIGLGFVRRNSGIPGIPDDFMPLSSTQSVGYGVAVYPQSGSGQLYASFRIHDSARTTNFPFAYVVSNSSFEVFGVISVESGLNQGAILHINVPEPSAALSFALATRFLGRHRNVLRNTQTTAPSNRGDRSSRG